jgi:hypothetical protein
MLGYKSGLGSHCKIDILGTPQTFEIFFVQPYATAPPAIGSPLR